MASVYEGAYASPSATAGYIPAQDSVNGVVSRLGQMNGWSIALTIFLGLVAYDQSGFSTPRLPSDNS